MSLTQPGCWAGLAVTLITKCRRLKHSGTTSLGCEELRWHQPEPDTGEWHTEGMICPTHPAQTSVRMGNSHQYGLKSAAKEPFELLTQINPRLKIKIQPARLQTSLDWHWSLIISRQGWQGKQSARSQKNKWFNQYRILFFKSTSEVLWHHRFDSVTQFLWRITASPT